MNKIFYNPFSDFQIQILSATYDNVSQVLPFENVFYHDQKKITEKILSIIQFLGPLQTRDIKFGVLNCSSEWV